ncbi:MAG TPA: energy transducer TonB [Rhizomicrobium sp.]|nr:energy transducer TonB [Rhizomicrobium sp.]
MIVIEFLIFVISSGVFYHQRFRHHLWAVIIAGAVATGSSLLFFWDLYEKMEAKPEAPVKIVKVVKVPVIQHVSRPPQLSKPQNCRDDYPFFARVFNQEGTTELAFTVLADGTVSGIKVTKSSDSDRLDNAAVECVSKWHYRPAIKDTQTIDTPMTVKVDWSLKDDADKDDGEDANSKGGDANVDDARTDKAASEN